MVETKMNTPLRVGRTFDVNEFTRVVGAEAKFQFPKSATGISLDSRTLEPGDLFFAIQSARDGHDFVRQAMDKGAVGCVVSRDIDMQEKILVADTLQCLWSYAGWVRKQWGKKIVALSGSNGKTSTKEMIATLLGEKALKTPGTWNNFLGVPLTLLMLEQHHEFGVIEIGINHFGELLQLCRFTAPNVALLTNVGPAHLENLHDLDGVAKAKGEIFSQLQSYDIAVIHLDDPKIEPMKSKIRARAITVSQTTPADVFLVKKERTTNGYDLKIKYGSDEIATLLSVPGAHNVSNYLCALGVALAFGIPVKQIAENTPKIETFHMRMQTHRFSENRILVNDCYNANPGSFSAALQTVSEMKSKRFLVFMGDMLEMGSQANQIHRDFGKTFHKNGVDHLFVTGNYAKDVLAGAIEGGMKENQVTWIEKKADAAENILSKFRADDILLVKASRGMKLEEVIEEIQARLKG